MADVAGGDKPSGKKRTMIVAVSAVIMVAVLVTALALSSGNAPGGNEGDKDSSDNADRNKLVSGVASDFILNQSDTGANWNSSALDIDLDYEQMNASLTSAAGVSSKSSTRLAI